MERYKHFHKYFNIQRVNNPQTLEEALRLRYQVYCLEKRYENAEFFPDGMEKDIFDCRADHSIIRHRETNQVIGAVRLVMTGANPGELLPIEKHFCLNRKELSGKLPIDRRTIGEVSRFAISKEFRMVLNEQAGSKYDEDNNVELFGGKSKWIHFLYTQTVVGLISSVIEMSADHGLTHWVCLMEPSLSRLLSRFGFEFKPIGPAVSLKGNRVPYYAIIEDEMKRVRHEFPFVWDMVADNSQYSHFERNQRLASIA